MSNSQIEDPKDTSVYYKMWWVFNIFIWYHCPSDNRDVHSMVEDCIVSPHNHLAEGDYCRDTKFQNGCLAFFQCCRWSHKHYRRKLNFEGTKDAAKFCETLFKITMWSFSWLNEIRLADYLQTNGQNNCNRMLSITKQIYNRIALLSKITHSDWSTKWSMESRVENEVKWYCFAST